MVPPVREVQPSRKLHQMAPITFSGIRMKIKLEESWALGLLRCPIDDERLLVFQGDNVTLKDCEHFRWHLGPDEREINKEDEKGEDEEVNEGETEEGSEVEWNEVLERNYIAAVSVEGGKFYLIHLEKAVKEG